MTPEAATYVEKILLDAQRWPNLLSQVLSLVYVSNSTWTSKNKKSGCGYPYPHLVIGWYKPEQIAEGNFSEIDFFGFRVFLHKSSLERLEGKQVVLEELIDRHILAIKDSETKSPNAKEKENECGGPRPY